MTALSSFEVLSETLVPAGILPPGIANPFVLQGFWVQISLAPGVAQAQFNLIYQETTRFGAGTAAQKALQAQVIGANGSVTIYPAAQFFGSTANGFLYQSIGPGQTLIYGIQAIEGLSLAALPQNGIGWRGTVRIEGQQPGSLIATPTQRIVYYSGNGITTPVINATVYAVPTFGGGTQI